MNTDSTSRNNIWKWLALFIIAAFSFYVTFPVKDKLRFGLDLKGGTSFTLGVDKDKLRETVQSKDNAEKWLSLIRKYTNLTMLTAPILNELVEKIVVHEATKDKDGKRIQKIEIYYRFVGKIDD